MRENADERKMDEIRALLLELGRWPNGWGTSTPPVLLDLYDIFEAPYQDAGRPLGDSVESLVRWWREQ
jgi:hypothetical protein